MPLGFVAAGGAGAGFPALGVVGITLGIGSLVFGGGDEEGPVPINQDPNEEGPKRVERQIPEAGGDGGTVSDPPINACAQIDDQVQRLARNPLLYRADPARFSAAVDACDRWRARTGNYAWSRFPVLAKAQASTLPANPPGSFQTSATVEGCGPNDITLACDDPIIRTTLMGKSAELAAVCQELGGDVGSAVIGQLLSQPYTQEAVANQLLVARGFPCPLQGQTQVLVNVTGCATLRDAYIQNGLPVPTCAPGEPTLPPLTVGQVVAGLPGTVESARSAPAGVSAPIPTAPPTTRPDFVVVNTSPIPGSRQAASGAVLSIAPQPSTPPSPRPPPRDQLKDLSPQDKALIVGQTIACLWAGERAQAATDAYQRAQAVCATAGGRMPFQGFNLVGVPAFPGTVQQPPSSGGFLGSLGELLGGVGRGIFSQSPLPPTPQFPQFPGIPALPQIPGVTVPAASPAQWAVPDVPGMDVQTMLGLNSCGFLPAEMVTRPSGTPSRRMRNLIPTCNGRGEIEYYQRVGKPTGFSRERQIVKAFKKDARRRASVAGVGGR